MIEIIGNYPRETKSFIFRFRFVPKNIVTTSQGTVGVENVKGGDVSVWNKVWDVKPVLANTR